MGPAASRGTVGAFKAQVLKGSVLVQYCISHSVGSAFSFVCLTAMWGNSTAKGSSIRASIVLAASWRLY